MVTSESAYLLTSKNPLKAYHKVLELQFKTNKLEMVPKRLVEINADLDEKYDAEPEENEEKSVSKNKLLPLTRNI